jgi:hypothetical protein
MLRGNNLQIPGVPQRCTAPRDAIAAPNKASHSPGGGRQHTGQSAQCCFSMLCFCSPGAGSGGVVAKDALGNDVKATQWLSSHKKGDRSLTQGLKVGCSGSRCASLPWECLGSRGRLWLPTLICPNSLAHKPLSCFVERVMCWYVSRAWMLM